MKYLYILFSIFVAIKCIYHHFSLKWLFVSIFAHLNTWESDKNVLAGNLFTTQSCHHMQIDQESEDTLLLCAHCGSDVHKSKMKCVGRQNKTKCSSIYSRKRSHQPILSNIAKYIWWTVYTLIAHHTHMHAIAIANANIRTYMLLCCRSSITLTECIKVFLFAFSSSCVCV